MVFVDVFCVVVLSLLCFLVFCLAIGLLVFYRGAGAAAFGTVQYVQCVRVSTVYFDSVQVSMFQYVSVQLSPVQYKSACFGMFQYKSIPFVSLRINMFSDKSIRFSTMQYAAVQIRRRQDVSVPKNTKNKLKNPRKNPRRLLKNNASMSGHCVKSPGFTAGRVDPINQLCHLIEGIL